MKPQLRCAALLCAFTLLTQPALAAESRYVDLVGDEWFAEAAVEMTDRGIMTGVSDDAFGPYEPVTRATAVTVLWRLSGAPAAEVEAPFPDTADTWYETAAAWAKGTGVAGGYDDGSFGGEDPVTREQLAVFFYRYALYTGEPIAEGALGLFNDVDHISDWAVDAVKHTVGTGVLQGDEGWLYPQLTANRAALAVTLQRLLTPAAG